MTFKRVWNVRSNYGGSAYAQEIEYDSLEAALEDVEYLSQATRADGAYMRSYVVPA